MLTPTEIQTRLERILPTVQKPGRYTGGELNQVVKNWDSTPVKIALVFPDLYDLGMSNLGIAILYDLINQREDALAERAYAPWDDMEQAMRQNGIPLYSLETKHSLADFDIVAFTLPYETLYTSTLNLLDLSGIPLRAADRGPEHPLIIAGGHAAFNPEPMHAFIDAFVIGEGEEVIGEIIEVLKEWKTEQQGNKSASEQGSEGATSNLKPSTSNLQPATSNLQPSTSSLLRSISQLWGVYVPSLYEAHYNPDGTFSRLEKLDAAAPLPIVKRIVANCRPRP